MTDLTNPTVLLPSPSNVAQLTVGSQSYPTPPYKSLNVMYYDASYAGGGFDGTPLADSGVIWFQNNPGVAVIATTTVTPLILGTFSQERLRITPFGLVGIGERAPVAKLEINPGTATNSTLDLNFPSGARALRLKRGGQVTGEIYNDTGQPVTFTSYAANGTSEGFQFVFGNVSVPRGQLVSQDLGKTAASVHAQAYNDAPNFRDVFIEYRNPGYGATPVITPAPGGATIPSGNSGVLAFQGTISNAVIYANSAAPLIFGTAAIERMRIMADGRIGIGTSTPSSSYLMDVNGQFYAYGINSGVSGVYSGGGVTVNGLVQAALGAPLRLGASGAERMRVESTGVTATSADNLPTTDIFQTLAQNLSIGVALGYDTIRMGGWALNSNLSINAKGTGHLLLQVAGTTGNVGIGAAPPAGVKLYVNGEIQSTLPIRATGTGDNGRFYGRAFNVPGIGDVIDGAGNVKGATYG